MIRTRASRKIIPVIASLLILHGLFGSAVLTRLGLVPTGLGFALTETVLGISLMLGYRWARWLTIGACFLAVAATFVVPILLFVLLGTPKSEAIAFWRNVTSGMAVVFGVVGWFGLAYLRSNEGRRMFSRADAANAALPPEPSWVVIPPAAVCLLLLLGTYDSGRRIELFFTANEPFVPPAAEVAADPPVKERVEVHEPVAQETPLQSGTMDIALTDMCIQGYKLRVQYTNLGTVPISRAQFGMQVRVDWSMVHLTRDFVLDVPETGASAWTPEFDVSKAGIREGVYFNVIAQTYSRDVGQVNWDNDRLIGNLILRSDRKPCPDVSTGS